MPTTIVQRNYIHKKDKTGSLFVDGSGGPDTNILPVFININMITQKQKILADIAKGIRESGFKGKIIPHLENEQLELHSAYHSDIIYNIRFHFDLCEFFIYRYFNSKWKPDKELYFGDFFLDDEVDVKEYDSMFDNKTEVKPDSNSLFYQKYAKKKRTI